MNFRALATLCGIAAGYFDYRAAHAPPATPPKRKIRELLSELEGDVIELEARADIARDAIHDLTSAKVQLDDRSKRHWEELCLVYGRIGTLERHCGLSPQVGAAPPGDFGAVIDFPAPPRANGTTAHG